MQENFARLTLKWILYSIKEPRMRASCRYVFVYYKACFDSQPNTQSLEIIPINLFGSNIWKYNTNLCVITSPVEVFVFSTKLSSMAMLASKEVTAVCAI